MANINPRGPTTSTGKNTPLGPTDGLADSFGSFIGTGTGMAGVPGLMGRTGIVSSIQGITGAALQGNTGIIGQTGIQGLTGPIVLQGLTGLSGITGLGNSGATGLLGATGIAGATGLQGSQGTTGFQGITGFFGDTGLQGVTGLIGATGFAPRGFTGITGSTGLLGDTGLVGATGIPMLGVTGLQGGTGIQGSTGLLDLITLDVQVTSGVTLLYVVPANTMAVDNQYLEIFISGLSATDGSLTTLILELGGYNLFNGNITFGGGADISLHGILIRLGTSIQESSIQVIYEDGSGTIQWNSITADLTTTQNLIASLTSAGTGHTLYSIVVRRLKQP
jgi:hypothetical protein